MRATISFQAEVDQVSDVMLALAKQETDNIRSSAHILETAQAHEVHGKVKTALEVLYKSISQLEQYRDMLMSFERARFETVIPQSAQEDIVQTAEEVKKVKDTFAQFDSFLDRVNNQNVVATEDDDASDTEEG